MHYEIRFSQVAVDQLSALRAFDRAAIVDQIEKHLAVNPTLESKAKIKQLEQPAPCQYRLRVEDFRIYYDVQLEAKIVEIIQVLSKEAATEFLREPS